MSEDIGVVFNVYKRPEMLEKQITAIKNQSVGVDINNIHVWYNKSDIPYTLPIDKEIKTYICNWNTKFWGRFTVPLLLNNKYIAIFDDDIIPNKDWFSNCIKTINNSTTNGILGGSGVLISKSGYVPNVKVGWNGRHSDHTERVDLVGHAWFFRQEWIKYLWYEKPYTWDNGEDIMFSYLAQKYGNVSTFVPPHPNNNVNLWSADYDIGINVGSDKNASWKLGNHLNTRNAICKHCMLNGWKIVNSL